MEIKEEKVVNIGRELFRLCRKNSNKLPLSAEYLKNKAILWGAKNPHLRTQLLRFVDVLPVLKAPDEINSHFQMYLDSAEPLPFSLRIALWFAKNPLTSGLAARLIESGVEKTARNFIAGSNIKETKKTIRALRKRGMSYTLDILGEATVSEEEAELYADYYQKIISSLSDDFSEINVSIKLSSLYSQFDPVNFEKSVEVVLGRLQRIFKAGKEKGVFINLDAEQYQYRDLLIEIFIKILERKMIQPRCLGIAYQTYYKDSLEVLEDLISRTGKHTIFINRPTIRLVKGAYWDYEVIHARQNQWPIPVFTKKHQTDTNFERAIDVILRNKAVFKMAVASHNLRSIAYAVAEDERHQAFGPPEFQGLYGMFGSIGKAITEMGYCFRVYAPCLYPENRLIPGMAYLGRRILENTSNDSFLLQGFMHGRPVEELLANPAIKEVEI